MDITEHRLFFFAGLAVIFAGVLFAVSNHELMVEDGSEASVLSCTSDENSCNRISISETVMDCEQWYIGMPESELDCSYTSEGLEDIGLISDPANHVKGEFTDQNYTKDFVSEIEGSLWDLEFLPDNSMIVTKRNGLLVHIEEDRQTGYNVDTIDNTEAGLMGVAVHPNFSENRKIYLYRTYERTNDTAGGDTILKSRISSFRLDDGLKDENVLIDDIPATKYHAGGRLEIGPDNKLYATTGDAGNKSAAQNVSTLNGKILRMNLDGTVPDDNPFGNLVYSYGHRNPQGLAWDSNGTLYSSEHGDWRYDELNRIEPGENYGWAVKNCEEFRENEETESNFTDPVSCYKTFTLAPSGMTFVNKENHPWQDNLFLANLRGDHVRNYRFDNSKLQGESIFFVRNETGSIVTSRRMRDVEFHNNSLYVMGDFAGIFKLTPKKIK